jgi:hypothetical protein
MTAAQSGRIRQAAAKSRWPSDKRNPEIWGSETGKLRGGIGPIQ